MIRSKRFILQLVGGTFIVGWGVATVFGPSLPSQAGENAIGGWTDGEVAAEPADRTSVKDPESAPSGMMPDFLIALLSNPGDEVEDDEAEVDDALVHRSLKVRRGDTLMKLLLRGGIPRQQAYYAIQAARPVFDPRDILPGQRINVAFRMGEEGISDGVLLERVIIRKSVDRNIHIGRDEASLFVAAELPRDLSRRPVRASGTIKASLYKAAVGAGVPQRVLADLIRIYSWDVDFQRDIRVGDKFDVVFERLESTNGEKVGHGKILYAALTLEGKVRPLYRYEFAGGRADYFNLKGESARKPLLRTPVDGARLSSRYGRRRHPILGYVGRHRGVDFAAARGTPIFAAGDGRITYRGRKGSYGRYVRIRHNSRYSTAYAHLYRFRRGVGLGSRVRQGQVIGYVGSSGRSTGPHLHYEVLVNGRQVNPLRVRMPAQRKLRGEALATFHRNRAITDALVATLNPTTRVASN